MQKVAADLSRMTLDAVAAAVGDQHLPPVENWHPARAGRIDIRIAADGSWWHEGGRINRPAMVRLFSTILRREPDGSHVLVTPAEKLTIMVDDLPFRAVEVVSEGEGPRRRLAFRLDTGDLVVAGAANPIRFDSSAQGEPRPWLHVRGPLACGLQARIARSTYYELVEMALADGAASPCLWSEGACFALETG
ncbi:MAG: hypothetical protein RLZZ58_1343 [Pseudomonadota bacterium]